MEVHQLSQIKIMQDLIRAKNGVNPFSSSYYDKRLFDLVRVKTKNELAFFLVDDNINIRAAAKLFMKELV
jgi:hypothetical protein